MGYRLVFDYQAAPKEFVSACNLCGGTLWTTLTDRDRNGFHISAHCCLTCGLVFLSPRLTREAYAEFYASGEYRALTQRHTGETDANRLQFQEKYAGDLAAFLRPFIPSNARTLLDIGGDGGVVASRVGAALCLAPTVLDPAAEGEVDCVFIRGQLETFTPQEPFDVVLLCQSVDHLSDFLGGLRKCRELVAPDGIFFVDIMDVYQCLISEGTRVFKIDHPFALTEDTFEGALRHVGFDVLRKTYVDRRHVGYVCRPLEVASRFDPLFNPPDKFLERFRMAQAAGK